MRTEMRNDLKARFEKASAELAVAFNQALIENVVAPERHLEPVIGILTAMSLPIQYLDRLPDNVILMREDQQY